MEIFKDLTNEEKELMFKAPAYISLLAANLDGKMDEKEKKEAIELTHIKTFNSDPLLKDYFNEVETHFIKDIEQLDNQLSKEKNAREEQIKNELSKLELILPKLGETFSAAFHKSFESYKDHVSKAHRNSIEFFLFPFYIKGLTD